MADKKITIIKGTKIFKCLENACDVNTNDKLKANFITNVGIKGFFFNNSYLLELGNCFTNNTLYDVLMYEFVNDCEFTINTNGINSNGFINVNKSDYSNLTFLPEHLKTAYDCIGALTIFITENELPNIQFFTILKFNPNKIKNIDNLLKYLQSIYFNSDYRKFLYDDILQNKPCLEKSNKIHIYFVAAIINEKYLLTPEGQMHAKNIGNLLKDKAFNKVYTSPIDSYVETLMTILKLNNKFDKQKRIVLDSNISGIPVGDKLLNYKLTESNIQKLYPDFKFRYERVSDSIQNYFLNYIKSFIDNIKEDGQDDILIVTNEYFLSQFYINKFKTKFNNKFGNVKKIIFDLNTNSFENLNAKEEAKEEAEKMEREDKEVKEAKEKARKAREVEQNEKIAKEVEQNESIAKEEAKLKAIKKAERRARVEAVRKALEDEIQAKKIREDTERKAEEVEQNERKVREVEQNERKAREAERKVREAKEEAVRKAWEDDRKAREEADRKAWDAKEEAERKAREDAQRKARGIREEAERKVKEDRRIFLRANTLPINELIEGKTKLEIISESLRQFGINYVNHISDLENAYDIAMQLEPRLRRLFYGNFEVSSNQYSYSRAKKNGDFENITFIRDWLPLASGTFNQVYLCTNTLNSKRYILKTVVRGGDLREAFYENIKHIILYILIRKYIGNIKFIPQPYHLGFNGAEVIMIMEAGKETLEKFFYKKETYENDGEKQKKIMWSIYNALYLINSKLDIRFKHNDLKCNNVLITNDNKPIIIDFGLCEFTVENMKFKKQSGFSDTYFSTNSFNMVHDMLMLMFSLYFIEKNKLPFGVSMNPIDIFVPKKNILETFILTSQVLKRYIIWKSSGWYDYETTMLIKILSKNTNKDINEITDSDKLTLTKLYTLFYDKITFNIEEDSKNLSPSVFRFSISPSELAYSIGLSMSTDEELYGKFEKKYLKYKLKYEQLKDLYFN